LEQKFNDTTMKLLSCAKRWQSKEALIRYAKSKLLCKMHGVQTVTEYNPETSGERNKGTVHLLCGCERPLFSSDVLIAYDLEKTRRVVKQNGATVTYAEDITTPEAAA